MAQTSSPIQQLEQQRLLLQLEYQTEKETFRQHTQQMGIERLVHRGDAWWPVKVSKSYYNSLNQLAVELVRTSSSEEEDDDHNFEHGKPVTFFTAETSGTSVKPGKSGTSVDTDLRYFRITGTVSFVDGDRMVVTIPDNSSSGSSHVLDLQGAELLGVQLSFDETSYRMMMEALARAIKGKGRLGYLRDLFYTKGMKP